MGQAEAELASGRSLGSEFSDACWSKMLAQPSESDFQRCPRPQVKFVPVAVMPQSSRGRSWGGLWEGAVTLLEGPHLSQPSHSLQSFDGPIIFYNWAKGPISWGGISAAIQSLPAA